MPAVPPSLTLCMTCLQTHILYATSISISLELSPSIPADSSPLLLLFRYFLLASLTPPASPPTPLTLALFALAEVVTLVVLDPRGHHGYMANKPNIRVLFEFLPFEHSTSSQL